MTSFKVNNSVMAVVTSQDQLSYIKIECQRNKTAKEIVAALQKVCGASALSYCQVTRWVNEFKSGRDSVEDACRVGRPMTAIDDYNTEQVKKLLKDDRRNYLRRKGTGVRNQCRVSVALQLLYR